MNLAELTALIYAAGDCTVTFTTINVPDMSRGKMYGVVTYAFFFATVSFPAKRRKAELFVILLFRPR